jgi:hypothetical protein
LKKALQNNQDGKLIIDEDEAFDHSRVPLADTIFLKYFNEIGWKPTDQVIDKALLKFRQNVPQ